MQDEGDIRLPNVLWALGSGVTQLSSLAAALLQALRTKVTLPVSQLVEVTEHLLSGTGLGHY